MIPVPIKTPMLYGNGLVHSAWAAFFEALRIVRKMESEGLLADIPTTFKLAEKGWKYTATDYARVFTWDGAQWKADPADRAGRLERFAMDPGDGYVLLDGSSATVTVSKHAFAPEDDKTVDITVCDHIGVYIKGTAEYTGALEPAVAPGLTGTIDPASAGTPTGSNSAPSHTLSVSGASGTATVQSGLGVTVAGAGHTHGITGGISAPAFTGVEMDPHTHGISTLAVDDTAEPAHVGWMPYIRL